MICQRCGKKEAEWRCSVCDNVVCEDCAKSVKGKIYCLDHAPIGEGKEKQTIKKPEKARDLKMVFYTLLALSIGLVFIAYIGEKFVSSQNLPEAEAAFEALKSAGTMIVYGMGGLTVLMGVIYLVARKI
ncbi:MAG: hypothetical protein ISS95_01335 [Candidatus Aenigmarchaeota archaeon]|nr:hypothetical protein [Candidatus Aenigmarchaeota archaeon]